MMLAAFSNMETIHIAAYSHLLDTIGMPEVEYEAFMKYGEMKDKYDYMQEWGVETDEDIAKTLAVFGGFTEGLQLFASFAILMNFPRFNKMKGMGQIVTWSARMRRCTPIRRSSCSIRSFRKIRIFGMKAEKRPVSGLRDRGHA